MADRENFTGTATELHTALGSAGDGNSNSEESSITANNLSRRLKEYQLTLEKSHNIKVSFERKNSARLIFLSKVTSDTDFTAPLPSQMTFEDWLILLPILCVNHRSSRITVLPPKIRILTDDMVGTVSVPTSVSEGVVFTAPLTRPSKIPIIYFQTKAREEHDSVTKRINEQGNIITKMPLSQELPTLTLRKEIDGTIYTITASYDGKQALTAKLLEIMMRETEETY